MRLQESLFELISSEASYLRSINVLISHFVQSPDFSSSSGIISKWDHRILFDDVGAICASSERFLVDLVQQIGESFLLDARGLLDVVGQHAGENLQVYISYCSNQFYQSRVLKRLR